MLNKRLCPEARSRLAAMVGVTERALPGRRGFILASTEPPDPSQGAGLHPPPPVAARAHTGKGGSCLCSCPQHDPGFPSPPRAPLPGPPGVACAQRSPARWRGQSAPGCPAPGLPSAKGGPAAAAGPLRARERVSSKREPSSAAVPDSSARCGRAQMPGPPPRLRQRSMQASRAPVPVQACQACCGPQGPGPQICRGTITSGCP